MKQQVLVIHGGDPFDTYEDYLDYLKNKTLTLQKLKFVGWKDNLRNGLGSKFEVINPQMPNDRNAKYLEWKIWFEKILPLLDNEIILVGHSLGGIFVVKYLSENIVDKKIKGTFLISAPYKDETKYTLGDFRLTASIENFKKQSGQVFLYHSKDDPVVPFAEFESYKKLLPDATFMGFKTNGHFHQEKFPEIVADIKLCQNMSVS